MEGGNSEWSGQLVDLEIVGSFEAYSMNPRRSNTVSVPLPMGHISLNCNLEEWRREGMVTAPSMWTNGRNVPGGSPSQAGRAAVAPHRSRSSLWERKGLIACPIYPPYCLLNIAINTTTSMSWASGIIPSWSHIRR